MESATFPKGPEQRVKQYEVERKVEISLEKRMALFTRLIDVYHFREEETAIVDDIYTKREPAPGGGYNTERLRRVGDEVVRTKKWWETLKNGQRSRREDEDTSTLKEFKKARRGMKDAIRITRPRTTFVGSYKGIDMKVDMDSAIFDSSPEKRYFIEAEVLTTDKDAVPGLDQSVKEFLKELLETQSLEFARSMHSMAAEGR